MMLQVTVKTLAPRDVEDLMQSAYGLEQKSTRLAVEQIRRVLGDN